MRDTRFLQKRRIQLSSNTNHIKGNHDVRNVLLMLLFFISTSSLLQAQASLAAENMVEDITVTTKYGKLVTYTLIRDAQVPEQWYYMPRSIRVAEEVDVNGNVRPKMAILKYQYQDKITKVDKEGAILSATFTMAMEPEVVEEVKKQLLEKVRKVKKSKNAFWIKYQREMKLPEIRLAGIPLESCKIQFLNANGNFLDEVDAKASSFDGATTVSQEMVMSYDLTPLGANVFEGLATGQSGLTMRASITYSGLTPPCGFNITGKWDNVYSYFEKQSKKEGGVNLWIVKIAASDTKEKKRESLEKIQNVTLEQIGCKDGDSTSGGPNLEALLTKIENQVFNTDILTQAEELGKLQSMLASTDDKGVEKMLLEKIAGAQNSIKLGYQRSVKDIEKRQTGEINYKYSKQNIVERKSTFGGGLSFANYNLTEEQLVSDGYVILIDANKDFKSTIFGLPIVNPDYNLNGLVLEIKYKTSNGTTKSEARRWTNGEGWQTPTGQKVSHIRFNLIGEKDDPEFDIHLQVIAKSSDLSFNIDRKVTMIGDETFVDALEIITDTYMIDGQDLSFKKISGNDTDLSKVKIEITSGEKVINKYIRPFYTNGIAGPPKSIYLLLPKGETNGGKVVFSAAGGVNEVSELSFGENVLFDEDWKVN
jgi:hypothetical protein